jgi:hypothetical protein
VRPIGLLREPILHFLLIGVALFVGYGLVSRDRSEGDRIVVSRAVVDDLARQYRARWNRPPGDDELARLVEAHVRDEVLYREGVALGLDRDDPVIKRRVRQKLELIAEEALAAEAPTDAQLVAFMEAHADRFRRPPRLSFEQVLLEAGLPEARIEAAAAAVLDALGRGADPSTQGAATLLPGRVEGLALDLAARDFGADFVQRLQALPPGRWSGPVRSGFGVHVVRVNELVPAELPPLDAVRAAVLRDWELDRRQRSAEDAYRRMRGRYVVTIEPGGVEPAPKAP